MSDQSTADQKQADLDNHSKQLTDEHDAYWQSRGHEKRPDNDKAE